MTAPPLNWSFTPSEGIDALVFCNAVSRQPHYAGRYPGLREEWAERLGAEALRIIDEGMGVAMSGLAAAMAVVGAETLDDVLHALAHWDTLRPPPAAAAGLRAQDAATVLRRLREAGFSTHWRAERLPVLEAGARALRERAATQPLDEIQRVLSTFLRTDRAPAGTSVRLAWYIRPIAFQLPRGGMAAHPDDVPSVAALAQICLHESLHGFPGADAALAAQSALMTRVPEFARYHDAFVQRWRSGAEEHLVTGAEAYLSERLMLRTRAECLAYLTRQNGGMPFAWSVYERLRETGDWSDGDRWPGFGAWAAMQMNEGELRWPGTRWPGGAPVL